MSESTGDSLILREYLISLGFKTNANQQQHFGESLSKWDKAATKLGYSLVGVATAAQAMATEFAFRMERLYYASRLAESAAGNLQALDFGGKQAGIKDFTANVMSLARSIRANPGLQGLLNSLGVRVEGRDKADVLLDLVHALKAMPFYVAQRYAALFGIDPDELKLMEEGLDKIKAAAEERKQAARDLGVDSEAAVKAGLEYAQQWREILMYVGLFRDQLSITLLGPMREMAGATKELLSDWIRIVKERDKAAGMSGITAEGARQSGLTVDEQTDMAIRAPKSWSQMTPDERERKGMGRDKPNRKDWSKLTPDERTQFGMPRTEADLPWYEKLNDYIDNATTALGLTPANPEGGAELSSQSKERIGQDRLDSSNPEGRTFGRKVLDAIRHRIGYTTIPKTPYDPAAVDAATEPAVRAPDSSTAPLSAPQVPVSELQRHPNEQAAMRQEEQARGLPTGLLDYIWRKESGRGQNLVSGKTATGDPSLGPFQFQPATGKQFGLDDQSIMQFGPSMKAAGALMQQLMQKYGGDMRYALAAYNWGEGHLDKLLGDTMAKHGDWSQGKVDDYVLGHVPEETRKYIAGIGADGSGAGGGQNITINAETKIEVNEAANADEVAQRVADHQRQVWGNIARDFSPKVR